MTTGTRVIHAPNTYHTFERVARAAAPQALELPIVLIGPHRQVFDPFDATGLPKAEALMGTHTWQAGSKNVFAAKGAGREYSQYDIPELEAGAKVEELDIWATFGSGVTGTVTKLRAAEDEAVIASNDSTVTLTPATSLDGFSFTLTDATVNFYRAFQAYPSIVFPSTDAELSEGGWAMVRLGGVIGGPFYVSAAPSQSNPYQLTLTALGYTPIFAAKLVTYEVVSLPREFDLVAGPLASRVEFASLSRLSDFPHLRLIKPGTAEITVGGGHCAVLILTFGAAAALVDEDQISLTDYLGATRTYGMDIVGDGTPSDIDVVITGLTAPQVAAAVAAAIDGDGILFDAFVHPVYPERVVVRQVATGVAGNTAATAENGVLPTAYDYFANAPDGAVSAVALTSVFYGGSALAGTTYTFKNLSDLPVRLTFAASGGVDDGAHPGFTAVGEYAIDGLGLPLPNAARSASVYQLNALLAQDAAGAARCYIEPSSIDTWDDVDNISPNPTATLSQMLHVVTNEAAAIVFQVGVPAGEIEIPAAEAQASFFVYNRLVEAFKPTESIALSVGTNDRGAIEATDLTGGSFRYDVPTDDGTVLIGRPTGSTAQTIHEGVFSELNAAIQTYLQVDQGYEHAPDDILRLASHPADLATLLDDDTDWYVLPALAGMGIDAAGTPDVVPEIYYDDAGAIKPATYALATEVPTHIVEVQYRTTGVGGDGLNVGFIYNPNAGVAQALEIVSANGELLITLPTDEFGVPVAITLDEIAIALDELDGDEAYIYPAKIATVWLATTGAEVDPVDALYSGWNAINVEAFCFREISDYTTTGLEEMRSRLYTAEREESSGGSTDAVARLDDTLIGKGSLGTIQLYADYVALRTDSSPIATIDVHGRTPDLVRVRPQDLDTVVGPVSLKNPMRTIFDEFFATSKASVAYFIGVDEVDADSPWGTEAAYDRAWTLALRRGGFHHFFFNDADWVLPWSVTQAEALGGEIDTETGVVSFLVKPAALYIPVKIPEIAPDARMAQGTQFELVSVSGTNTIFNSNVNFISAGVQAGDILLNLEYYGSGPTTLQDGRKGWTVIAVDVASPTRITLKGTGGNLALIVGGGDPAPFEVWRPGASLRDTTGEYLSDDAVDAMIAYHTLDGNWTRRVQKHVANTYQHPVNGVLTELDGVYLLAQYAGIIARTEDHLPSSAAKYSPRIELLDGGTSYFSDDQLNRLTGAGLTFPQQLVSPNGPVDVRRDVTSDTSTKTMQRRGSLAVEALLVLRIDRSVRPRLAQQLLTLQFLDMVVADVDATMTYFRDRNLFKYLEVDTITEIDDTIREEYGIDDTGVLVVWKYTHVEEAAAAIFHHVVNND